MPPRTGPGLRRSRDAVWVGGSVALHVVAALVLWLTPAREILFRPTDPTEFRVTARAERIEEMVQHLRDREGEVIREKVEELFLVERELELILDDKHVQYEELAVELAEDAADKALRAQEEALKAQAKALAAEKEAIGSQSKLSADRKRLAAAEATEDRKAARDQAEQDGREARGAQQRVRDAQAEAGDAQRRATQALTFARQEFSPARRSQQKANAAQQGASEAQDRASGLQERSISARGAAERADRSDQAAQTRARTLRQRVAEAERKAAAAVASGQQAREKLEAAHARVRQARAQVEDAQKQADAAKAQAQKTKSRQDREEAKQASKRVSSVRSQLARGQREEKSAQGSLDTWRRRAKRAAEEARTARQRVEAEKPKTAQAADAVKRAREADAKLHPQALAAQSGAEKAQARATEAQRAAIDVLRKAIRAAATRPARTAESEPVVPPAAAVSRPADTQPPDLAGRDIAQLYDEAVEAEGRVAERYRHVHATDVAMIRNVPLADALKETVVPKTRRPALDRGLLTGSVRSAARAEAHRREVDRADQEVTSMVAAAHRFLNMARGAGPGEGGGEGTTVSVASIKAASARHQQMRELAAEDASARYKDLSGAMRRAAGAGGGGKAPPKSGRRKTGGYNPDPYPVGNDVKAIPGRKVLAGAARSPKGMWMYVDSWYTIGPFPNPNRRNIDTQFPPQSVIDLNAVYRGKGGRAVRWEFIKSANAMVIPDNHEEYGIWYAYTELWFEKAMDLQIAIGSDDNSRLWIEGQLVWISGRQLKPWRAGEGYRLVHFRKGLNRVLYRVENGWREIAFSFLICLKKPRSAPRPGPP